MYQQETEKDSLEKEGFLQSLLFNPHCRELGFLVVNRVHIAPNTDHGSCAKWWAVSCQPGEQTPTSSCQTMDTNSREPLGNLQPECSVTGITVIQHQSEPNAGILGIEAHKNMEPGCSPSHQSPLFLQLQTQLMAVRAVAVSTKNRGQQ